MSLRAALQLEITKPHLLEHELLVTLAEVADTLVIERMCTDATSFVNALRGDSIFLPATKATHTYVIMEGEMNYIQEPSYANVTWATSHILGKNRWCVEASFWC